MGVIGLTGNILLFPKLGSIKTVLMPRIRPKQIIGLAIVLTGIVLIKH